MTHAHDSELLELVSCEMCGAPATHCVLDLVEIKVPRLAPWNPGGYRWGCDAHPLSARKYKLDGSVNSTTSTPAGDDLDPVRGILVAVVAGVLLWAAIGFVILLGFLVLRA